METRTWTVSVLPRMVPTPLVLPLLSLQLLIVALSAAPRAFAEPVTPLGNDFQLNSFTTDFQRLPSVAQMASGDFVVVWQSRGQDGDAYGIFGQRFDSLGNALDGEFPVNAQTTGDQSRPRVASLASGGFIVVWDSTNSPGGDSENRSIIARRFDSTGEALGSDFQVNDLTAGAQLRPDVIGQGGGGFVVAWESANSAGSDASNYSIQGRRFDAAGTALGADFQVNVITTGRQVRPAVSADNSGAFVVVWENEAGTDGDGHSVAGRRFDSGGVGIGDEFQANVYTTGDQQVPRVATTPTGAFLVVWQGPRPNGEGDDIVGRRFAADGAALGVEFRVNSFTLGEQAAPTMSREPGGNFLVVWQSSMSGGTDNFGTSIQARLVTAGGNPLDSDFQTNTYTTNYQTTPAVASDGESGFLVAWSNFENIGLDGPRRNTTEGRQGPRGGTELAGTDSRSVLGRRFQLMAAELTIAEGIGAGAGEIVEVPITLNSGGLSLSSLAFSVDYDESCLEFDPTDDDLDGLPDAITFTAPPAFDITAFFDAGDHDGEIDIVIADVPPMAVLADGAVAVITFGTTCIPPLGGQRAAAVGFAEDPAPSFGDEAAQSVAGRVTNGSVEVYPGPRGDCNGDAFVDAADVSATGLELFDADGNFWLDTPGSTFAGSPVGCDSNADTVVDAGDVACTVRRIFSGLCAGEVNAERPRLELPAQIEGQNGDTVTVPLSFVGNGEPITTVAFSINFEESILAFDPFDGDLDGVPDAVRFVGTAATVRSVTFMPNETDGELDFLVTDLSPAPGIFSDGVLLEVDFEVIGVGGTLTNRVLFANSPSVSFGDEAGRSIEGDAELVSMVLFGDGFESGDTAAWSSTVP